tara:strand:- start:2557 stop:3165 length:609 start_codon:yes stop_codon:yes gene_type:complete
MAIRLEPYRDYSEHEVINLFSLDTTGATLTDWKAGGTGDFDAGVVVAAKDADLPGDLPSSNALKTSGALRDYLGASGQPHVGYNAYPIVEMTCEPATAAPIGITLRQSLAYDENGESLLRYPVKKDELQAVLPGHAVPILTRGLVLLGVAAFDAAPSVGDKLALGAAGKLAADAAGTLGQVIAKGVATNDAAKTKFLCKVSF